MIEQLLGYERVAWCISDQQLATQSTQGQLYVHTKVFENRIHICCLIGQLLVIWPIYSESYEYSPYFHNLFHFPPKRLKVKFAFFGLIRQLPLTWPIHSEHYEYCPFSSKVSLLTFVNFITNLGTWVKFG
jgi:hypothetical protein